MREIVLERRTLQFTLAPWQESRLQGVQSRSKIILTTLPFNLAYRLGGSVPFLPTRIGESGTSTSLEDDPGSLAG